MCAEFASTVPQALLAASDSLAIRLRRVLAHILPETALTRLAQIYRSLPAEVMAGSSLVRKLEADLLFCPFTAPFFFDRSVPVVSVIYDLQYRYYPEFFTPVEIQQRDRAFRQACQVANKLVCISDYVRKTVLEASEVTGERVETIHISLPDRLRTPSPERRERVLRELGLTAGRFLLYPANFWRHKNHELLLTAFSMHRAAHPGSDLKLVLTVAPGLRRDELIEARRRMGLSDCVIFPGYLPDEDFAVLMSCCEAVIFPSLFEGFGMPLLEAMAAGRPLLCSNATSLPEVAGDAGLLFDPRKPAEIVAAISRLEDDPDFRLSLAEKSKARLSSFEGAGRMAAQYWEVFAAATARPKWLPGLYGAFEDGWAGERLTAVFCGGPEPRRLTVTLTAPEWIPLKTVTVRVVKDGVEAGAYTVNRGESIAIVQSLGAGSGSVELLSSPTFQPKRSGMGNDTRMLACRLESAVIVDDAGDSIPLGVIVDGA